MKKTTLFLLFALVCNTAVLAEKSEMEMEAALNQEKEEEQALKPESDPEWYVAPVAFDSLVSRYEAPRRALAAADCPMDSICHFNVDSVLTNVTVYEYGDTTRTLTWTVNPDGSRFGNSKTESGTKGDITFSASYVWDHVANDWKGSSKEEHTYTGNNETLRTLYAWVNGAWMPDTKMTWVYDGAGRETEFTTYVRNTEDNELVYSKQRIREYNTAGKTTLDIQYTAHDGSNWSAGTKRIYDYDGTNIILNEYYSAYTNGAWVGSSKEIWTYTSGQKTYYEKDVWSNGAWVGSSKEIWIYTSGKKTYYEKDVWSNGAWAGSLKELWEFNGPSNKQTLHEKYGWSNGDWTITLQENTSYTGNNNTSVENYSYTNGVQKGTKKEEYLFSGSTKIGTITYKWSNNTWVNNVWTVSDKVSNPNESCKYVWTNNAWVGNGSRTLTTNNSSKKPIEVITQSWSTDVSDWVNVSRKTTEYTGSKTTQEALYSWSTETNDWLGTSRSDWHYNAAGQNDTIKTYSYNGSDWIYSNRTVKTYNAAGTEIMVHNAAWDGSVWVMTSMTRSDISDATIDGIRQTLNASWRCEADSIWIGLQKDSSSYTESGKTLYRLHCEAWSDNDWVPSYKIEYEYDDNERVLVQQQLDWVTNTWKGFYRYEYNYDVEGRQTAYASYNGWNTASKNWIGTSKTETVYNSDGDVEESLRYTWDNNDWIYTQRYIYTYDSQKRTIRYIFQLYTNGNWTNSTKNEIDYAGEVQVKDNNFIWLNNEWVFSSRNETYYDKDAQAKLRRQVTGLWSEGVVQSFADNHYHYDCDIPSYTIRFLNYDGEELASYLVKEGKTPSYSGVEPVKPAEGSNSYTFAGWSPAIAAATGDATYTATFTATQNKFTITWQNEDGSLIEQTQIESGQIPTHEAPVKENTAEFTYSFAGWTPEIIAAIADATYRATFSSTVNKYLVTFKNGDEILQSGEIEYGAMPVFEGATPEKEGDAQYTYSFAGWDNELAIVTGEATYNATFSSTVNKYPVIFKNGEEILQSGEMEYGAMPVFEGATPEKEGDAQYSYSFAGWDNELAAVTGEATYNAIFSSTVNKYLVTFKNGEEILQSGEIEYGAMPVFEGATPEKESDAQYSYTFAGWDNELAAVTGEATYNATFSSTVNTYTITFYYEDGETVMTTQVLAYGEMPGTNITPSKTSEEHYYYHFVGWSPELEPVTGDASYTPVFTAEPKQYTITFKNYNGWTLQTTSVTYGEMPVYTGATPEKQRDQQYTYVFAGWSPELSVAEEDVTYTAVFEAVLNQYTIVFVNEDGTELDRQVLDYGTMPEYEGETPTKEPDEQFVYTFEGWSPQITTVTRDATYRATYSKRDKHEGLQDVQGDNVQSTKVMIDGTVYILRGGKLYTLDGTLVE